MAKAVRMVDDAYAVGCECVKFQSHVVDDEMIPNDVVPGNATESIWDIMARCALGEDEERKLKEYVEGKGMLYLCTPFSRAAAERLERLHVPAYKIGSGECNNYPLVKLIASWGQPVILSTGMNDIDSVRVSVEILRAAGVPFALLHCTSIYPTPYATSALGHLRNWPRRFPTQCWALATTPSGIGPASRLWRSAQASWRNTSRRTSRGRVRTCPFPSIHLN